MVKIYGKLPFAVSSQFVTAGLGHPEDIFQDNGGAEFGQPLLQKLRPYWPVFLDQELCLVAFFLQFCIRKYYNHN